MPIKVTLKLSKKQRKQIEEAAKQLNEYRKTAVGQAEEHLMIHHIKNYLDELRNKRR